MKTTAAAFNVRVLCRYAFKQRVAIPLIKPVLMMSEEETVSETFNIISVLNGSQPGETSRIRC